MKIRIVRQVNSRWSDGRSFAAMPGRELAVDDTDTDLVAHMRHLVAVGDAQILETVELPAVSEMDDLREQAGRLGVKIDGRWSTARLREEIDKAANAE